MTPEQVTFTHFAEKVTDLVSSPTLADYWRQALPLMQAITGAKGVAIIVPDVITVSHGKISAEGQRHIESHIRQEPAPASLLQRNHWLRSGFSLRRTINIEEFVHIPISRTDQHAGVAILVFEKEQAPEEFTPLQRQLVDLLFSLAIMHGKLRRSEQRQNMMDTLFDVTQDIASTLDLSAVLQETTNLTCQVLNAEAAALMQVDFQTNELIFSIPTGEKGAQLHQTRMPMNRGVAGWVARTGKPLIVNDPAQDVRFNRNVDKKTGFITRSIVCVPLQIRGQTIGILEVLNKRDSKGFSEEDLQWLLNLAPQAAIAVENARLYQSLRRENQQVIAIHEEVRHHLARDLHDGPAQDLSAMIMGTQYARRLLEKAPEKISEALAEIETLARQANTNIRTMLFELRPIVLETKGLVAAIQAYIAQETRRDHNSIVYHLSVIDNSTLETEASSMIFSIIQEALNNIRRHAQAKNVWIRIFRNDTTWVAEIEDDGQGFEVSKVMSHYENNNSFGLLNMKERAQLVGGVLQIVSPAPGKQNGTCVRLSIPLAYLLALQKQDGNRYEEKQGYLTPTHSPHHSMVH